jgi:hypothetical protein
MSVKFIMVTVSHEWNVRFQLFAKVACTYMAMSLEWEYLFTSGTFGRI